MPDGTSPLGLPALPPDIDVDGARLPALYESARNTLAECSRIDECQQWADKAEALASYARQSQDDALRRMCDRIQARAIRRCGELLKEVPPAKGGDRGNAATGGRLPIGETRSQAAADAGLSPHQAKQALRVANVPAAEFEQAVEAEEPVRQRAIERAEAGERVTTPIGSARREPDQW